MKMFADNDAIGSSPQAFKEFGDRLSMADVAEDSSSLSRVFGKALFVWNKDETMDDNVMEIMDRMKAELILRGINVTDNDSEEGCNIFIIFVTKDFLIDHYEDFEGNKYRRRGVHSAVIIDDDEKKFAEFVRSCVEYDHTGDYDYLKHFGITDYEVIHTLGIYTSHTKLKQRTIYPGVSPAGVDEIQAFAVKFAEDAFELLRNPKGIHNLESDIQNIYETILYKRNHILDCPKSDDFLFVVFAGCQSHCFDMTTLSELIANKFLTPYRFVSRNLPKETYHRFNNDPLALQKAFVLGDSAYIDDKDMADKIHSHLEYKLNKIKYFTVIDDFDVSNPQAQDQLTNLAYMLGRQSIVIITTSVSGELLDKMDPMKIVRRTAYRKDTPGLMAKCYTILRSKFTGPMKKTHASMCYDCPWKDNARQSETSDASDVEDYSD